MDVLVAKRKVPASLCWMLPGLLFYSYVAVRKAGLAILYKPVLLAEDQVKRNLIYREGSTNPKHQLDLFLPNASGWPAMIFVHGGGLASGDKGLRVGGADVYGNIGRFYASRGIGVAVINYRLQPKVTWREQVEDVAHATAWVRSHIRSYGGDDEKLFIGGHSAGAYLASRIVLDSQPLGRLGLSPDIFRGVIALSGAAYDLSDVMTYELGAKLRHYQARFRCGDPTENWKREASPIHCQSGSAPPFLILYAGAESKPLRRQSELLHDALQRRNISSELIMVPGQTHKRIVLTLSRPDKISAQAILRFISEQALCAGERVKLPA